MDDYRPDCAENPAVKTPPPGQGLDRPAARRPDYTCTQSVIGAPQTPQIDARKPAAGCICQDIERLILAGVGAAEIILWAVLYRMNGAMPGRMAPTVKTISKHLPRDGRALRRQLENLAARGLTRLIAREKSGVFHIILNLPLIAKSPKPRDQRQLTLPLEWQEPVDHFDVDAWMREHADELPHGQMSACPETTRTNVRATREPADKCPRHGQMSAGNAQSTTRVRASDSDSDTDSDDEEERLEGGENPPDVSWQSVSALAQEMAKILFPGKLPDGAWNKLCAAAYLALERFNVPWLKKSATDTREAMDFHAKIQDPIIDPIKYLFKVLRDNLDKLEIIKQEPPKGWKKWFSAVVYQAEERIQGLYPMPGKPAPKPDPTPPQTEAKKTEPYPPVDPLLAALAQEIGQERFQLWFGPGTSIKLDGQVLAISAPNQFFLDWIRGNFRKPLEDACFKATGVRPELQFRIETATGGKGRE